MAQRNDYSYPPGLNSAYEPPSQQSQTDYSNAYYTQTPITQQYDPNTNYQFPPVYSAPAQSSNGLPQQYQYQYTQPSFSIPQPALPAQPIIPVQQVLSDDELRAQAIQAIKQMLNAGISPEQITSQLGSNTRLVDLLRSSGISEQPHVPLPSPSESKRTSLPSQRPRLTQEEYAARLKQAQAKKEPKPLDKEAQTNEIKRRIAALRQSKKPSLTAQPPDSPVVSSDVDQPQTIKSETPQTPSFPDLPVDQSQPKFVAAISNANPLRSASIEPPDHVRAASNPTTAAIPGLFMGSTTPSKNPSPPAPVTQIPTQDIETIPSLTTSTLAQISSTVVPPQEDDSDLESGEIRSDADGPLPLRPEPPRSHSAFDVSTPTPHMRELLEQKEAEAKLRAQIVMKKRMAQLKLQQKQKQLQEVANKFINPAASNISSSNPSTPSATQSVAPSNGTFNGVANERTAAASRPNSLKRRVTDSAAIAAKRARMEELQRELDRIKADMELDDDEGEEEEEGAIFDAPQLLEPRHKVNGDHVETPLMATHPKDLNGINGNGVTRKSNSIASENVQPIPDEDSDDETTTTDTDTDSDSDTSDSDESEEMEIDNDYEPEVIIPATQPTTQSPLPTLSNVIADDLAPELQPQATPEPVRASVCGDVFVGMPPLTFS
jgi:hypothetical protein